MSTRATRWLLFSTLALTLPLPFFMAGVEIAPLARLLFLEGVMLAVVASDGLAGSAGLFVAFLAVQGVLLAAGLWGLAWVVARALRRMRPTTRAACAGFAATCLLGLSLLEIYRTPHSSSGPTANLLGIFD
jgi:hypothetical protein